MSAPMKRIIALGALSLALASPLTAQQAAQEGSGSPTTPATGPEAPSEAPAQAPAEAEDGSSLMERGARLFLEGLLREMEPAIEELQGLADEAEPALRQFAERMGPALAGILGRIDDLSNYELPEMLPNGDIIIRRKVPLVPRPAPEPAPAPLPAPLPGDEIEL